MGIKWIQASEVLLENRESRAGEGIQRGGYARLLILGGANSGGEFMETLQRAHLSSGPDALYIFITNSSQVYGNHHLPTGDKSTMSIPQLAGAIAFWTVIACSFGFAQQPLPQPPLITTRGSAQIRVVPDLADLYFEVDVRNADLDAARKEESTRMAAVLATLRATGVAEAELQSSQVQIAPDYGDRRQETERVKFFRVFQSVCCTLHELNKIPDVTANAIAARATGIRDVVLRASEVRKYRDEARSKAALAAKEKASSLAVALGVKLGKPHTILEGASDDGRYTASNTSSVSNDATAEGEATDAFAPGTIFVNATVSVAFDLE